MGFGAFLSQHDYATGGFGHTFIKIAGQPLHSTWAVLSMVWVTKKPAAILDSSINPIAFRSIDVPFLTGADFVVHRFLT